MWYLPDHSGSLQEMEPDSCTPASETESLGCENKNKKLKYIFFFFFFFVNNFPDIFAHMYWVTGRFAHFPVRPESFRPLLGEWFRPPTLSRFAHYYWRGWEIVLVRVYGYVYV